MAFPAQTIPDDRSARSSAPEDFRHLNIRDQIAQLAQAFSFRSSDTLLWLSLFTAFNLIIFNILLGFRYFAAVEGPLRLIFGGVFAAAALPLAAVACADMAKGTASGLRLKIVDADFCVALAVAAQVLFVIYSLLFNTGYLPVQTSWQSLVFLVALILFIKKGHEILFSAIGKGCGFDPARLAPYATVYDGEVSAGNERPLRTVRSSEIRAGDIMHVKQDQYIACDGAVLQGRAQVMEHKYSGLGELRHKTRGDDVTAGSLVMRGEADIRASGQQDESSLGYFTSILNRKLAADFSPVVQKHNLNVTIINILICSLAIASAVFWIAKKEEPFLVVSVFSSLLLISILPGMLQLKELIRPFAETLTFVKGALAPQSFIIDRLAPLKSLIVDYSFEAPPGIGKVQKFELLDNRIEEQGLFSVIFAVAARADDSRFYEISRYIAENSSDMELPEISEFAEYAGKGICAAVSGADISLGSDEFLVERGVMLQASEIKSAEPGADYIYAAVGDEPEACFTLFHPFSGEIGESVSRLRKSGVRTLLCSTAQGADLDQAGRGAGFELADIYGALNRETFQRKISSLKPAGIFVNPHSDPEVFKSADVSVSVFDDLLWDLKRTDISVFSRHFSVVADQFLIARAAQSVLRQNYLLGSALCGMLAVLAVPGLLSPFAAVVACGAAGFAMLLNVLRIRT